MRECAYFFFLSLSLFVFTHRDIDTTVEGGDAVKLLRKILDYSVDGDLTSLRIKKMDIDPETFVDISVTGNSSLEEIYNWATNSHKTK